MKQKHQISFLALVLTMLLLYPGAVKMVHTHHENSGESLMIQGVASMHQTKDSCPVCDFEFVSFISEPSIHIDYFPFVFSTINDQETEKSVVEFTRYFSLRAPPAIA